MIATALLLVAAYLIGSIPFGILVGRGAMPAASKDETVRLWWLAPSCRSEEPVVRVGVWVARPHPWLPTTPGTGIFG